MMTFSLRTSALTAVLTVVLTAGLSAAPRADYDTLGLAASQANAGPGCGLDVGSGPQTVSVPSAGASYDVRVHVPTGYDPTQLTPAVLNLHGSGSTGQIQEATTGMDPVADKNTFIVAYPDGGITQPVGHAWNVPGVPLVTGAPVPAGSRNDVRFLTDLVNTLQQQLCVDTRRVYATGMSGGGRMASALGCARADVFAAIAPVGGVRVGRARPHSPADIKPHTCRPTQAVPVLAIHGRKDPVNPYRGNTALSWGYSVPVAMNQWATLDHCRRRHTIAKVSKTINRLTWRGCGGDVQLLVSSIAGHTWPGEPGSGTVDETVDGSTQIWAFFQHHTRG